MCAGDAIEELCPSFSYRGYQFAEIRGLSSSAALLDAEAVAIGSDLERTGWFRSSEKLLEQIYELAVCSLRSNYIEVPTDCPQRAERYGWLGDASLFAPMAAYTYDISSFMSKWFDDVLDARSPSGGFAPFAPRPSAANWWEGQPTLSGTRNRSPDGAPGWADVGVVLPWLMYERYGDREILERMFPAMQRWLEQQHGLNPDGIRRGGRGEDYGDWQPAGPDTSHELFATCWLYRSTVVGHQVAKLLDKHLAAKWLGERGGGCAVGIPGLLC